MLPTQDGGYEVNYRYDNLMELQGITCLACHVRRHVRFGPKIVETPPVTDWLGSGHGGAHTTSAHSQSEFCSRCHQFDESGRRLNGKLLQDTFSEWVASPQAEDGLACQTCHMPERAHTWKGIHDPATVREAIEVRVDLLPRANGQVGVDIKVTNTGAGHHLPTYVTPKLFVIVRSYDERERYIGGSEEVRAIGRDIVLGSNRQEELYDSRIPAGAVWRWRYRRNKAGARGLSVEVAVHPDHFYERFFSSYDRSRLGVETEALIDSALARTKRSTFRVYHERLSLSSP